MAEPSYTEDDIKSLSWREHIRLRPGMYIGKLGDGSEADDGIYVLLEGGPGQLCIDEFVMGYGKRIEIGVEEDGMVEVRDFRPGHSAGEVDGLRGEDQHRGEIRLGGLQALGGAERGRESRQ